MTNFDEIIDNVVASNVTETKGLEQVTALFNSQLASQRAAAATTTLQNTAKTSLRTDVNTFVNGLTTRDLSNIPTDLRNDLAEYVDILVQTAVKINDLLK